MNAEVFDDAGRTLAQGRSRRGVLRLLGAGIAGGAVAATGLDAAAKKGKRPRNNNPLEDVNVSGVNEAGKKVFVGKLDITSFEADGETLYAVGALSGRLTRNNKPRKVAEEAVRVPVTAINGVDLSTIGDDGEAAASRASTRQLACDILTLTLGPLDLNLLGLRIQLNQVDLDITALPGGGLLGDLLCIVANLLIAGGLLAGLIAQIADVLNQILDALG